MADRRTFVTIEVEMGVDDEWHHLGLEEAPEDAASLLATIKKENNNRIPAFIDNWSLDDFVTVTIAVRHNEDGHVTNTVARWNEPETSRD